MGGTSERRLAAILSADIVGYSRLMAADEDATVAAIRVRRGQVTTLVGQHGGRLADFVGDNFLAEFPSALQAVECALAIQAEVEAHNAELSDDRQVRFRIGAHLGDVRVEDERLYGEGINIAARLEALGQAGALCLSDAVYAQVRNKLALEAQDLGEHTLKNIPQPVRAYLVRTRTGGPPTVALASAPITEAKPAIAVLPFENMSGDPEQEYFGDGMAEDIITDLSKVGGLLVIARNSSFTYKGRAVDVRTVANELNVTHVVEGSVRKAGERVRVTVQLIDAATGHHLWSERYDRTLTDIFALQDELTTEIVGALRVKLSAAEEERVARGPGVNLEAYDLYLRGRAQVAAITGEGLEQKRELLEAALALDPSLGVAHASLARAYQEAAFQRLDAPREYQTTALEHARKAVEIQPDDGYCHAVLAFVLVLQGRTEDAMPPAQRAIALNPNEPMARSSLGWALAFSGQFEEALGVLESAVRLDPHEPMVYAGLGNAYRGLNRLEDALDAYSKTVQLAPRFPGGRNQRCIVLGLLDRWDEARAEAAEILRLQPDYSMARMRRNFAQFRQNTILTGGDEVLRRAGLPEGDDQ